LTSEINYCIPLILSHAPSPWKLGEPCEKQTHYIVLYYYSWLEFQAACWGPPEQPSSAAVSPLASAEQLLSSEREREAQSLSGTIIRPARASLGSFNASMTREGGDIGS